MGRALALANTAVVLARWGYRILCVDWDLDAPGLSYTCNAGRQGRGSPTYSRSRPRHAGDPADYIVPIDLGTGGQLDLLPAGREDDEYVRQAQELDWAALYDRHGLGAFLERCRDRWRADYDMVLVDSRTGITDIGGICTAQLPDVLVMLFTANDQSLAGTLDVARRARAAHDRLPYDRPGLMIVPVPSRFDADEEYERSELWRDRFATELVPLLSNWAHRDVPVRKLVDHLVIPYRSFWSFGEDLPAVVEPAPSADKIGYWLETLAALVAHRLDRTSLLAESRDSYVAAAARGGRTVRYDVFLSAAAPQRAVAERLTAELEARSLTVFSATATPVALGEPSSATLEAAIADCRHLVVLVGSEGLAPQQMREVERFLRQNLDDNAERLVIPVQAPGPRPAMCRTSSRSSRSNACATTAPLRSRPWCTRSSVTSRRRRRARARSRMRCGRAPWTRSPPCPRGGSTRCGGSSSPTAWMRWNARSAPRTRHSCARSPPTWSCSVQGARRRVWGRDPVAMPKDLQERVDALITRLGGQIDAATAREGFAARLARANSGDADAVLGLAALAEAAASS